MKNFYERKKTYISRYAKFSNIRYSLQKLIGKAYSTTSFSSEDVFPSVSLSVKKLELVINDDDGKENENIVDVTGLALTSYVHQNKIIKLIMVQVARQ